ncbi:hypothetical protein L6164_018298 [Bauhinia variegata]|nr:hypothetical protein L6164_018298 [Bauhinia variegata]
MELVDKRLGSDFNEEEATVVINVALLCASYSLSRRPTMSSVVSMLESRTFQEVDPDSSEVFHDKKFQAMKPGKEKTENHSFSTEAPWTDMSSSVTDLRPEHLASSYWEGRD